MKTVSKVILIAIFLLFIWLTKAIGQSNYTLEPFDDISITGNIDVLLKKGDSETAEVKAYGIPEDKVTVRVSNGTLKLKLLNSIFYKDDEVRIIVTYKNLRGLRAQAGATVKSDHIIEGDKLEIAGNSGAKIDLEIKVNALDASASEGSVVELYGETSSQNASSSTGAEYDAQSLNSERAYIKAGTGGQAYVRVSEFLKASANTGGNIKYRGSPNEKQVKNVTWRFRQRELIKLFRTIKGILPRKQSGLSIELDSPLCFSLKKCLH